MINAIAIDDEPIALEIIEFYAQKVPFLSLTKTFINAFDALACLKEKNVDLLFLDIKMPDVSGIDFFTELTVKPFVVFTTAYSEHAVSGFELEAIDYLLKPFSFPRFLKACNKVHDLVAMECIKSQASHIFVKDGYDVVRLDLQDLLYLEATGNYMSFVTKGRQVLARMTIKEAKELLPESQFAQVHRSFVVNLCQVDKLEKHQIHIAKKCIPVSSSYLPMLRNKLL